MRPERRVDASGVRIRTGRIADEAFRLTEVDAIEEVEGLDAELDFAHLVNAELLEERRVGVEESRPAQGVAPQVAERADGGSGEDRRVEELLARASGANLSNQVGAVRAGVADAVRIEADVVRTRKLRNLTRA